MTPLDLARWRALCEEAVHDALGHGVVADERAANVVRMVLAAFVEGLSEEAIVRMVVAAENGGRPHRVAVENFRAELLKEAQRA